MNINEKVQADSQIAIDMFSKFESITLNYDVESVKHLDQFINEKRHIFIDDTRDRMVSVFGAFLGESIRRNYGGSWNMIDDRAGIQFDENNAIFPFGKVRKQFENGGEDSILSFFQTIPTVFNLTK
ncbi:MAG: hypothetical protein WKF92_06025 [Pyrinomonadaceae bacterium]